MNIQLELRESHSITSYDETQLCTNGVIYKDNTIITNQHIHSPWDCQPLYTPDESNMDVFLQFNPEMIVIGRPQNSSHYFLQLQSWLSKKRIGLECMSIGAACRTFNVLIAEDRRVAVVILFHLL